jgi:hypothetical protein
MGESPLVRAGTVSGKLVMSLMVLIALVVGAVVSKVRMDNWAERAAYRSRMMDAGWNLMEDGTLARDGGEP